MPILTAVLESPVVTESVRVELHEGVHSGHSYLETAVSTLDGEIPVCEPEYDESDRFGRRLGAGETSALYGALANDGVLATDDLDARHVGTTHDVPVTGSIGLLVVAVRNGALERRIANDWLETWREKRGYFAPVDRVDGLLDESPE